MSIKFHTNLKMHIEATKYLAQEYSAKITESAETVNYSLYQ